MNLVVIETVSQLITWMYVTGNIWGIKRIDFVTVIY